MNKAELYAKELYDLYCEKVGGVAFNGLKLPIWEEFSSDPDKERQTKAWRALGEYVHNLIEEDYEG